MTLSRGPSASTSGYSHMNVDRNNSITSNNTGGEPIVIGPSSSVVTSLYRDDSTVSRVSSLPQEYKDIKKAEAAAYKAKKAAQLENQN